ncbi:hypothetical protein LUZ60_004006 [Juncus effusus]|nr:hypothetical protein LUZ60_004006 [Juncus effusus]
MKNLKAALDEEKSALEIAPPLIETVKPKTMLKKSSSKPKPCSNRTETTMNKSRKTGGGGGGVVFPTRSSPSGWSQLPSELLDQICSLLSPSDQHRVRLICSAWRAVAKQSSPPRPLPFDPPRLLLLRPDSTVSFFNLFECKLLTCSLPVSHRRSRCVGYLSGWFVLISDQNPFRICLLNPTSLVEIPLPLLEFPAKKAVLSSPPGFANCTVAIMGRSSTIALSEPAGKRWRVLDLGLRIFQDLTFWRNQLCALEINGNVLFCNFNLISGKTSIFTLSPPEQWRPGLGQAVPQSPSGFLVESTAGELLLVNKTHLKFIVFKLDNNCKWEQVDRIGDQALFLGVIRSEAVRVQRFIGSGLRENSIYFANKKVELNVGVVGVFSMEDECLESVPVSGQYLVESDPVWISPVIWP